MTLLLRVKTLCVSVALAAATGCAYYNGIYNAKALAKTAASDARHGRDSLARLHYALSASSAETVLVRYADSDWYQQALFLAGRGEALSGNCAAAVPRLSQYLASTSQHGARNGAEDQLSRAASHTCEGELAERAEAERIAAKGDSSILTVARNAVTIAIIDSALARSPAAQSRSKLAQRLAEQSLFYRILFDDGNAPPASQFLAAEVARDSMEAPRLAYATFMALVGQAPASLLAPKALRAAALLSVEHGPELSARILRDYPSSSIAAWMRGEDSGARPDFAQSDSVLRAQWTIAARLYADTLAKLRAAAARAPNTGADGSAAGRP